MDLLYFLTFHTKRHLCISCLLHFMRVNLLLQATMADNRTVDRARAWCATAGIVYLRLSPQLSLDVQLDERQDEILVNALWETMVYIRHMKDKINRLANLLTLGST